jgi:hypothetical protein
MYDQYNALGKEITQIGGSLKKYENEIHKNKSDLVPLNKTWFVQ